MTRTDVSLTLSQWPGGMYDKAVEGMEKHMVKKGAAPHLHLAVETVEFIAGGVQGPGLGIVDYLMYLCVNLFQGR